MTSQSGILGEVKEGARTPVGKHSRQENSTCKGPAGDLFGIFSELQASQLAGAERLRGRGAKEVRARVRGQILQVSVGDCKDLGGMRSLRRIQAELYDLTWWRPYFYFFRNKEDTK